MLFKWIKEWWALSLICKTWLQNLAVQSVHTQDESIGTYFILQRAIWKPVAWSAGKFLQIVWAYFRLCSTSVKWTRQLGLSATSGRLSLTTQCQHHRMLLPEANRCQNLTLWWRFLSVYHLWSNKSCSWIAMVVGSHIQIPSWYCIQVWVPFFPK